MYMIEHTHLSKKIKVGWARMSHQESVIVNDVAFLFKLSTCFEELGLCDTNTGLIFISFGACRKYTCTSEGTSRLWRHLQ